MNMQELKTLDRFSAECWATQRRPVEQHRAVLARRASIKFMWVVSLMAVFAFFSLLAQIAK